MGAVLQRDGETIAAGRNRVYDPPGGGDVLQGTPIAHAEMNALAALPPGIEAARSQLWSTHAPCSMCFAAAAFNGITAISFLATDPATGEGEYESSEGVDDVWSVVANALFLHNVAWVGGAANPMLTRNREAEPEIVILSESLLKDHELIDLAVAGSPVREALAKTWDQFTAVADHRRDRLRVSGPRHAMRAPLERSAGVRFLYVPAVDIVAMRRFYSELLGLEEIHFSQEEGSLAYDCDGFQFTVYAVAGSQTAAVPGRGRRDLFPPAGERRWATQPGWSGNTSPEISWSVELSEEAFGQAFERLAAVATVERLHPTPQWVGYWSFPVRDPMGNTVELSWPEAEPDATTWPDPTDAPQPGDL